MVTAKGRTSSPAGSVARTVKSVPCRGASGDQVTSTWLPFQGSSFGSAEERGNQSETPL